MRNAFSAVVILLGFTSCVSPSRSLNGKWTFIGLDHPCYFGNLGYTGEAAILEEKITFHFDKTKDFPPESNLFLAELLPPGAWGRPSLEYMAEIDLKTGHLQGPPFDRMPIRAIKEDGAWHLLIGDFDPPILFVR